MNILYVPAWSLWSLTLLLKTSFSGTIGTTQGLTQSLHFYQKIGKGMCEWGGENEEESGMNVRTDKVYVYIRVYHKIRFKNHPLYPMTLD